MFSLPNMLEIIATLYNKLDVSQKLPANEKLAYKDHRSLIRHQESYENMTIRLLEYIAPQNSEKVNNYLVNSQHFFCTFNSVAFDTELNNTDANNAYWSCILGPMVSTLLYAFFDDKYKKDTIHFIGKLLLTWPPGQNAKKYAEWAKGAIKAQNDSITPLFTEKVNDIRSGNIQSRSVINKNVMILKGELKEALDIKLKKESNVGLKLRKDLEIELEEKVSIVAAVYHAVMIIRRIEKKGDDRYLLFIKQNLLQLKNGTGKRDLLSLHEEICSVLLQDPNRSLFSWAGSELISKLDKYFLTNIKAEYPEVIDMLKGNSLDSLWPDIDVLNEFFVEIDLMSWSPVSPFEKALLNYLKMYYHVENDELEIAYEYCIKVDEASKEVQLGQFETVNLVHKIVLHWMIKGKMSHNQFDSDIVRIIMHLPDELECHFMFNSKFKQFYFSLNANEVMMFKVFELFNRNHEKHLADPLKKLTEIINATLDIYTNNDEKSHNLLTLCKKVDPNLRRTKSVLPFSTRLSLTDSVEMVSELYSLIGHPYNNNIFLFNQDDRCKALVVEFDRFATKIRTTIC
jgi:hypothetical protein